MTYSSLMKYVLIGKETTKGTGVTANKDLGLIRDTTDDVKRETIVSKSISSLGPVQVNAGTLNPDGDFVFEFQHGRILEYVLGSVSDANTGSDYKHTFTLNVSPPSFTCQTGENGVTDATNTFTGCMTESTDFNFELNDVLLVNTNFKGINFTTGTSASSSVTSTLPVFPHSMIHVSIGGSEVDECQRASIQFNKVLSQSSGSGTTTIKQNEVVDMDIVFSATIEVTTSEFDRIKNLTDFDFLLNAHNGVTLGSGRRELYIELENCIYSKCKKTASIGNLVYVEVEGTGTVKEVFSVDNIAVLN